MPGAARRSTSEPRPEAITPVVEGCQTGHLHSLVRVHEQSELAPRGVELLWRRRPGQSLHTQNELLVLVEVPRQLAFRPRPGRRRKHARPPRLRRRRKHAGSPRLRRRRKHAGSSRLRGARELARRRHRRWSRDAGRRRHVAVPGDLGGCPVTPTLCDSPIARAHVLEQARYRPARRYEAARGGVPLGPRMAIDPGRDRRRSRVRLAARATREWLQDRHGGDAAHREEAARRGESARRGHAVRTRENGLRVRGRRVLD